MEPVQEESEPEYWQSPEYGPLEKSDDEYWQPSSYGPLQPKPGQKVRLKKKKNVQQKQQQRQQQQQQQQQQEQQSGTRNVSQESSASKQSPYVAHAPLRSGPPPPPPPPSGRGPVQKPTRALGADFAKELVLKRKKLKAPYEILKQVNVERPEMFDQFKKFNHMPMVDSREYLRTLKMEIVGFSLVGVEQLSDAFLFSLYHCKLELPALTMISLAGCYNVSDEGVYWLTRAFKKLKSIDLTGCNRITEKAIHYVRGAIPSMKSVIADGTSCGVLPINTNGVLVQDDGKPSKAENVDGKLDVHVNGCPLISPFPADVTQKPVSVPSKYRKIVILTTADLPCDPLAVLTNQKDITPKLGLVYKSDWMPFKDHKMANVSSSAEIFNIFQIPVEEGISDLVLSPGSIVILPYRLHKDTPEEKLCHQLAVRVGTILSKYDDCTFALLGVCPAGSYTGQADIVLAAVQERLKLWFKRLGANLGVSIHTNWRMAALNYQEQTTLSVGQKLLRQGTSLYQDKQKPSKGKQPEEKPMVTLVSSSVKVGEVVGADLQFLADLVATDEKYFPWNRNPLQSNKVFKYTTILQNSSVPLVSLSDLCQLHRMDGTSNQLVYTQTAKVISYAALWGQALFYPNMENQPVITDFQFLARLIQKVFFSSAARKCDISCLGDSVPCWKHEDLMKACGGGSKSQTERLMRLLEVHGYLFRLPIDPWSTIQDVSSIYVLYKDFPVTVPPNLTLYWPDQVPEQVVQKEKFYFAGAGLPDSFFPNLLRHAMKLGPPVLLWKQGAVIQKGFVTILIEKIDDALGLPAVVMQVRAPSSLPKEMSIWTMLQLYTCIVDYLIMKYGISMAKSTPCMKCWAQKSRYEILKSKHKMQAFFLEHLARAGDHRELGCKSCNSGTTSSQYIGPVVSLVELVPPHDLLGKALPTDNLFNRCLMCEHCAIDGMDCSVNLKHGKLNWFCECHREGMICDNCGMCQRCFLYIKRIMSTLQPKFDEPRSDRYGIDQLNVDKLKVTERGSVLGFIEENLERDLEQSILTPNYCPNLNVTVIKERYFNLSLQLKHPELRKIRYVGKTGCVYDDDKQVSGLEKGCTCCLGETLSVTLRYIKAGFTEMRLSVCLNGTEIYGINTEAQRVYVMLANADSQGIFLQIQTPGKLVPNKKLRDWYTNTNMGQLPCSLEMSMNKMIPQMEEAFFGGRGISMTGAACVGMPTELTLEKLRYPTMDMFERVMYHHLCLTFNPSLGKKHAASKRIAKNSTNQIPIPKEYDFDLSTENWSLRRLVHLLDAPGILDSEETSIDHNTHYFLAAWHFLLVSYPEMLLPRTLSNLLGPELSRLDRNKLKAGLREVVRAGFWKYFSNTTIQALSDMFNVGQRPKILTTNSKLIQGALLFQEMMEKHVQKTGLEKIYSKFNKSLELFLCPAHVKCMKTKSGLTEVIPEVYGNYSVFISFIDFNFNAMTSIPDEFFKSLPNLIDLKLGGNYLSELPGAVKYCRKLNYLNVNENDLTDLPAELLELQRLPQLYVSYNCFKSVPDIIVKMTWLTKLGLTDMMITELPEDFGNLENLTTLFMDGNCLTRLPASFTKLKELDELRMGGVPWIKITSSKLSVLSYEAFKGFLVGRKMDRWLESNNEDREELFHLFDVNSSGVLELKEIGKLNAAIFNLFPRFGPKGKDMPDESMDSGFPREILSCTKLRLLGLHYQGITSLPPELGQLTNLQEIQVSHNPNLLSVPAELSLLKQLTKLDLEDCPLLKTPPREIKEKGFHSTLAYLQRLMSGAVLSRRTKLMLVGLGGAGKTSLVKAFLSDDFKADLTHGEAITDGIEIKDWHVQHEDDEIVYNIWDFAGQTVYYNTHQFFLSTNRAIYVLLWNVRLGYEHAGLDFWLSSISVQAPNAPIFIVGSHIDQVSKAELPLEEMQQRYPQISSFHFISSFSGKGVKELRDKLVEVTLQQQYMGEHIPAVWFTFEQNISTLKKKHDIVEYKSVAQMANKSGIFEDSEIYQAVQFLHDLGSVQHFSNEYLKTKVVINPQWIVDVMACVVSVKNDVIKDGRLNNADISTIWSSYPEKLHSWLLRLTEEFDLTFPLNDSPINLVPCLLPEKRPQFTWPEVEKGSGVKESKMVYTFDYLPAGLFNRGQVRLHHLSDSALIWKKGSFLNKNVHIALIQQTRESELVVMAQGPRPENILFLVHEVFEGLIAESFHGVTYDFHLPCPECQRMLVKDAHMFAASTIRRAIDMKAPFLQCIKYFHTISCADLLTLLPPSSHSDFDAHLVDCVQGLKSLRKDLAADIFISNCANDDQLDKKLFTLPKQVLNSLTQTGFRCWSKDTAASQSTDEMAKALIDSSVFLAFVSMNYAQDDECVNIFKYARLTLRKNIVVVAIGDGFEWKQSKLGILLSDEVFINMTKAKHQYYDSKYEELLKALSGKARNVTSLDPSPTCFFSYTWVNSTQAVTLGTREIPGALGYGDPRDLKSYLEEHGVSCWIDVERVGMNGLFDDIAEGLLSARVVIVCVSDEYASSPTCQIEFRYAANTLKLPIVMAVVGTGDQWRATEVGLMSVQYPIVNLQEKTKNARKKLLALVEERLADTEHSNKAQAQNKDNNNGHKDLSFQELFELAQRKLLRQLMIYAENQDLEVYPRLFVLDFLKDREPGLNGETTATEAGPTPSREISVDPDEILDEFEDGYGEDGYDGKVRDEDEADGKERGGEVEETKKESIDKMDVKKKKLLRRHTLSVLNPAYKMEKFCVYTLCEHDEGWHSVAPPIRLGQAFGVKRLDEFSPFLSRMTAVMKYNKKLLLNCFTGDVGADYIKWLEESPDATMSDYQLVYHSFRLLVSRLDRKQVMGGLMRCHLTNGKTIWLCPEHRQKMRVTCLSNTDKTPLMIADQEQKVNDWMLTALRTMDYHVFASQFKKVGNAPRPRVQEIAKAPITHRKKRGKPNEDADKVDGSGDAAPEQPSVKTDTSLVADKNAREPPKPRERTVRRKESKVALTAQESQRVESKLDRQVSDNSMASTASLTEASGGKSRHHHHRHHRGTPRDPATPRAPENQPRPKPKGPTQTSRACSVS